MLAATGMEVTETDRLVADRLRQAELRSAWEGTDVRCVDHVTDLHAKRCSGASSKRMRTVAATPLTTCGQSLCSDNQSRDCRG